MANKEEAVPTVVTVEKIMARTSSKSNKPYWTVAGNGEFYNIWDSMVAGRLEQDKTYTLMVQSTESGDKVFHNIVGIAPDIDLDMEALGLPQAPTATKTASRPSVPTPATVEYIQDPMIDVRKTALVAANALLCADRITQKAMNEVLQKYEAYILGGIKIEQKSYTEKGSTLDLDEFVANA